MTLYECIKETGSAKLLNPEHVIVYKTVDLGSYGVDLTTMMQAKDLYNYLIFCGHNLSTADLNRTDWIAFTRKSCTEEFSVG